MSGRRVTQMYAFIAVDENGDEGVVAVKMGDTFYPLVGADMSRIDSLRPSVQGTANSTNTVITLLRFGLRETLETIVPIPKKEKPV